MNLKLVVRWEVKDEDGKRSIQLFDKDDNKLEGYESRWEGNFDCTRNQLTTLEGAPKEVGGGFYCEGNQLTSLEGAPKEVGGYFSCNKNQLTTLKGAPREVGGHFYCYNNQLTSLEGAPREVGGDFYCYNNQLTTLKGAPREVGGGFYCYNNQLTTLKGAPREVGGYFYCYNNQLTTLKGAPREVGGYFYCRGNPLTSLDGAPKEIKGNHREVILDLIRASLLLKGILFADSIMSKIISSKNNVYKIRIYGKKDISYCIYRDGNFSHGNTLKEAIDSLRYKASIRNVEEFKSWKLNDIKSLTELISAYRSITGACAQGVKLFCESITPKDNYTIEEVIKMTEGKWGNSNFNTFFKTTIN